MRKGLLPSRTCLKIEVFSSCVLRGLMTLFGLIANPNLLIKEIFLEVWFSSDGVGELFQVLILSDLDFRSIMAYKLIVMFDMVIETY